MVSRTLERMAISRAAKYVLGKHELAVVGFLNTHGTWSGEVAELAGILEATPFRTWHAVARLAERGIVAASAGETSGAVDLRWAAGGRGRLATMRPERRLRSDRYRRRAG